MWGGATQTPQVSYDRNPMGIVHSLFARLVTALVTVLGAAIVTAGLLSYGDPAVARVVPEPTVSLPPIVIASPTNGAPGASPTLGPGASANWASGHCYVGKCQTILIFFAKSHKY